MQFNLRQLLLVTTLAAFTVAAAAALPSRIGALIVLAATLILPGALATAAFTRGPQTMALCLPAIVPIAFGLYGVAWAVGWMIYQSGATAELWGFFELHGRVIKLVLFSSWLCGALAGLVGLAVRRMATRDT